MTCVKQSQQFNGQQQAQSRPWLFQLLSGVDTKIQRSLSMGDVAGFQYLNIFSNWNHRKVYKSEMCQAVRRSIGA